LQALLQHIVMRKGRSHPDKGQGSCFADASKERLDILVQRQAGVTRAVAQSLIIRGLVYDSEGNKLDKCGLRLPDGTPLQIRGSRKYVSRGGEKLEAALTAFSINPAGRVAIDVGASTGGFTDCLLQHGASKVYAVDVGYGQLAWKLRNDPRVVVMERTNIRHLQAEELSELPSLFVIDCSFISLRLVLPCVKNLLSPNAEGVALIKPQFEAGKDKVGKGGVVRDENIHRDVIEQIKEAAENQGFRPGGVIPSPLLGPAGNREYLMYLKWG